MSRTRGHDVRRYVGHKIWLAEKVTRKYGSHDQAIKEQVDDLALLPALHPGFAAR